MGAAHDQFELRCEGLTTSFSPVGLKHKEEDNPTEESGVGERQTSQVPVFEHLRLQDVLRAPQV